MDLSADFLLALTDVNIELKKVNDCLKRGAATGCGCLLDPVTERLLDRTMNRRSELIAWMLRHGVNVGIEDNVYRAGTALPPHPGPFSRTSVV